MCVLVCLCYLQVLTAPWVSGAFALVLILGFTIAGALSGLAGGSHHHLLGPDLSRRVDHLARVAVQSRCEEMCGRVDVWSSSW
jgi:hypothetical protein